MVAEPSDKVSDLTARRSRMLGPIQLVRRHASSTGSARAVLNVIASYCDADTLEGWVGRTRLCKDAGVSRSTARRGIRRLVELGEIEILEEGHGDRPSRYRLALSTAGDNPVGGDRTRSERGVTVNPGRVHAEPGGGFTVNPQPRGPIVTGGGGRFPDHCPAHAEVEDPPPCRRCKSTREANETARLEAERILRRSEQEARIQAGRAAAAALPPGTPPPDEFRQARRRRMTDATQPGTVSLNPKGLPE